MQNYWKKNSTLEFLDLGHNRIRDAGLKALINGISANPQCKIKSLGLRFNFITDEAVCYFLEKINLFKSLSFLFLKNNRINDLGITNIKKLYDNMKLHVFIDIFDKLKYNDNDLLDRTVWIFPANTDCNAMKNMLEDSAKCGIVLDIRKRKGNLYPNRSTRKNEFFFVEFAHPVSVNRALFIKKKILRIGGTGHKVFKAGTATFIYSKTQNVKKVQGISRTNVLRTEKTEGRGRGGRGGGYRGRGRGGRRSYRGRGRT